MANIGHISPQVGVEKSQNFNTLPYSRYLETFDTTNVDVPKKWENKQRRKFTTDVISTRLKNHELTLPKECRGSWNSKIARQYVPDLIVPELLPWEQEPEIFHIRQNKYGEPIWIPTDVEKQISEHYNHNSEIGNQLRWKRMIECHQSIQEYTDQTTGEVIYKATNKCNDKLCLICSQIRSRVAIIKYQDKVNQMIDPVMVVLHQRSPGVGELKQHIDQMYQDWRSIFKVEAKSNRESMSVILALEVTTNETNQTYHPHYHIIIEKRHAERLVGLWIAKDPLNRLLHAHTNDKTGKLYTELEKDKTGKVAIHELFKYAMKMSVTNQDKPGETLKTIGSTHMIYEIAKALKGVQQWRPFGDFRATPNTKEITQAIQDEMTVQIEDHPHIQLSKKWNWNGMDWESWDIPGLPLVGKRLPDGSIVFLRLTDDEYNNFVNDKRDQPKQPRRCEILETIGEIDRIQEIPGNQTTERSIHHHKPPPQ
jgi:hypothetical protein